MAVVSNTSPILNLAIIGEISLLRNQFREICIPQAVMEELRIEEGLPGSEIVKEALFEGWLRVSRIKNPSLSLLLMQTLDRGEAEAIALALEMKAEWLLLDEQDARRASKPLGIKVTGVLGILMKAYHGGQIPSFRAAVDSLRQKAGFWVGEALYQELIRKVEG